MTQSFINPLSKFTSDTLKTLPYSRLYFFENESSTPKEIFKDKAKTISWGVYAEADSAGNFPPIWFDGICRATLKWSSNWLTDPVGVVQTQWPIDNIGTDQSFDTDVTIDGDLTANNVYSEGVVQAAGNAGFQSTEYTLNARNPIWSFGNADTYGISYFAGTPSIGADDKIGIHFGTATLLGSEYTFDDDGNFTAVGDINAYGIFALGDFETEGSAYVNGGIQVDNGINVTLGGANITGNVGITGNVDISGTLNVEGVAALQSIKFENTSDADPLVLDWYQEGVFTPVAIGSTVAGTGTYTGFKQTGTYTRIGNRVFFRLAIGWSAHTGTGNLLISGLPFTASSFLTSDFACSTSYYGLLVAAGKSLGANVVNGTAYIQLSADDPAGGAAFTAVAMDAAVGQLNISGHYEV